MFLRKSSKYFQETGSIRQEIILSVSDGGKSRKLKIRIRLSSYNGGIVNREMFDFACT